MVNLNCHQTDDERKECEGMRAERRDARAPGMEAGTGRGMPGAP